jgi:hypothetical protein
MSTTKRVKKTRPDLVEAGRRYIRALPAFRKPAGCGRRARRIAGVEEARGHPRSLSRTLAAQLSSVNSKLALTLRGKPNPAALADRYRSAKDPASAVKRAGWATSWCTCLVLQLISPMPFSQPEVDGLTHAWGRLRSTIGDSDYWGRAVPPSSITFGPLFGSRPVLRLRSLCLGYH